MKIISIITNNLTYLTVNKYFYDLTLNTVVYIYFLINQLNLVLKLFSVFLSKYLFVLSKLTLAQNRFSITTIQYTYIRAVQHEAHDDTFCGPRDSTKTGPKILSKHKIKIINGFCPQILSNYRF